MYARRVARMDADGRSFTIVNNMQRNIISDIEDTINIKFEKLELDGSQYKNIAIFRGGGRFGDRNRGGFNDRGRFGGHDRGFGNRQNSGYGHRDRGFGGDRGGGGFRDHRDSGFGRQREQGFHRHSGSGFRRNVRRPNTRH